MGFGTLECDRNGQQSVSFYWFGSPLMRANFVFLPIEL